MHMINVRSIQTERDAFKMFRPFPDVSQTYVCYHGYHHPLKHNDV